MTAKVNSGYYNFFFKISPNNIMLETELITFGLKQREAKVYLVTMKMGEASASAIAKRAGLPRLSVYSILERLHKRGVVNYHEKRNVRIYKVAHPDSFLKQCDLELFQIQAKREHIKCLLPRLRSFMATYPEMETMEAGEINFIEDLICFQNICKKLLNDTKEWLIIHDGTLIGLITDLSKYTPVIPYCLIPASRRQISAKNSSLQMKTVFFPDHQLRGPLNVMIMGTVVMFIVQNNQEFLAVEVRNSYVAHTLKSILNLLWNMHRPNH